MMRGVCGSAAVILAAILVCCSADPHAEQEVNAADHQVEHFDSNGHKNRNMELLGSRNLVRQVRESRGFIPYFLARRLDNNPNGLQGFRRNGYYEDDLPKRNFDEIDRSNLDTFVAYNRKRNFDEIDQTSMPFPYAAKRNYRDYSPKEYPMDEIDLSLMPIGSKRSFNSLPLFREWRVVH